MQLILASQNQGKLKEARALLEPLGLDLHTISEYPQTASLEIAETAQTFADNALLKAQGYAAHLHLPILSDDSGLEVLALGNEPGVASNRWFPGTDADRNTALLKRLEGITDRRARFVTVLCLLDPSLSKPVFFKGEVNGVIAHTPKGLNGFGYDPIFIPDGFTQSFAELGTELKNTLSHRAKAMEQLLVFLSQTYPAT